jgi:hypothetical protein
MGIPLKLANGGQEEVAGVLSAILGFAIACEAWLKLNASQLRRFR